MSARWRSPTGSAPARVTSPASSPGRHTSWSTFSSRAPSGAPPRPSPRQLDEVGGDCNAFTTKEYTTFYVRLLSEHLPLGLDILSDIMWAAGAASRRHRGRAHRHPRRDPDARRRARRPGGGAVAGGALPRARPRAGHPGDGVVGAAHHPRRHPRLLRCCTTGRPTWSSRSPATAPTRRWRPTWNGVSPAPRAAPPPPAPRRGPTRSPSTWSAGPPSRRTWSTACARSRASTSGAGRWPC